LRRGIPLCHRQTFSQHLLCSPGDFKRRLGRPVRGGGRAVKHLMGFSPSSWAPSSSFPVPPNESRDSNPEPPSAMASRPLTAARAFESMLIKVRFAAQNIEEDCSCRLHPFAIVGRERQLSRCACIFLVSLRLVSCFGRLAPTRFPSWLLLH
jgi:hypothetical protein